MAFDYTKLATTASTLVERFGRTVTLTKSGSTLQVAGEPWRGVSNSFSDASPGASVTTKGVFTDYRERDLSDEVLRGDKMLMVAAAGIADITMYDGVKDGSTTWRIVSKSITKPGGTALLYTLQVRQ